MATFTTLWITQSSVAQERSATHWGLRCRTWNANGAGRNRASVRSSPLRPEVASSAIFLSTLLRHCKSSVHKLMPVAIQSLALPGRSLNRAIVANRRFNEALNRSAGPESYLLYSDDCRSETGATLLPSPWTTSKPRQAVAMGPSLRPTSRPATNDWTHRLAPCAIFLKVSGVRFSEASALGLSLSYVLNEANSVAFKLLIDGPQQP